MTTDEIDRYLADLDGPTQGTLIQLHKRISWFVPDLGVVISHGIPAFEVRAMVVAGTAPSRAA